MIQIKYSKNPVRKQWNFQELFVNEKQLNEKQARNISSPVKSVSQVWI